MKNKKSILLITIAILISMLAGFLLGKGIKPKLYLPIYEYSSAIDGEKSYANISDSAHGLVTYRLSKVIPCNYDICKWIPLNHSSAYESSWIMFDGNDTNNNPNAEGGYYFYDFKLQRRIFGPFDAIMLERPTGDWALRKVIVLKNEKYGLFDIISKDFIFTLDYDYISFIDDHKVLCEKDGKNLLYEINGNSKSLIAEDYEFEEKTI